MSKIDTTHWCKFQIESLFNVVKGTRLTKANMKEGNIRFIGASSVNNGITAFISNDEHLHPNNTITISYNGSVGEAFYQDERFWASDDVNVLYPKFPLNCHIAMFIIPLLKKAGQQYAFIDKWKKEDMGNDFIKLPVNTNGTPDWCYMESYTKVVEATANSSLKKLRTANKIECNNINTANWGEFFIKDIFEVKRPIARSQKNYEKGTIPFVASGNYNNGVIKYLQPKEKEELEKGNCITVSPIDGSSFYQKDDFLGRGGAGSSVILLYNKNLNIYNGYFIATVIRAICSKYIYSDMANKDTISEEKIKLPVNSNDSPDFLYMELYMKNLETTLSSSLINLQSILI